MNDIKCLLKGATVSKATDAEKRKYHDDSEKKRQSVKRRHDKKKESMK